MLVLFTRTHPANRLPKQPPILDGKSFEHPPHHQPALATADLPHPRLRRRAAPGRDHPRLVQRHQQVGSAGICFKICSNSLCLIPQIQPIVLGARPIMPNHADSFSKDALVKSRKLRKQIRMCPENGQKF